MIRLTSLLTLALIFTDSICASDSVRGGDKSVANFTLQDFRGKKHSLADFADNDVVVLAFLGTECPLVKLYGPVLQRLADDYRSKNVAFIGLNPNRQDSLTDMAAYSRRRL